MSIIPSRKAKILKLMSVSFSFRINYTLDDFGDIMDSFGYDQGMMSGVNISPDYVRRMKIGDAT